MNKSTSKGQESRSVGLVSRRKMLRLHFVPLSMTIRRPNFIATPAFGLAERCNEPVSDIVRNKKTISKTLEVILNHSLVLAMPMNSSVFRCFVAALLLLVAFACERVDTSATTEIAIAPPEVIKGFITAILQNDSVAFYKFANEDSLFRQAGRDLPELQTKHPGPMRIHRLYGLEFGILKQAPTTPCKSAEDIQPFIVSKINGNQDQVSYRVQWAYKTNDACGSPDCTVRTPQYDRVFRLRRSLQNGCWEIVGVEMRHTILHPISYSYQPFEQIQFRKIRLQEVFSLLQLPPKSPKRYQVEPEPTGWGPRDWDFEPDDFEEGWLRYDVGKVTLLIADHQGEISRHLFIVNHAIFGDTLLQAQYETEPDQRFQLSADSTMIAWTQSGFQGNLHTTFIDLSDPYAIARHQLRFQSTREIAHTDSNSAWLPVPAIRWDSVGRSVGDPSEFMLCGSVDSTYKLRCLARKQGIDCTASEWPGSFADQQGWNKIRLE